MITQPMTGKAMRNTPSASTLDALSRTSDQLSDDLLLPDETVKIRAEARDFATTMLAPRAAAFHRCRKRGW